MATDSNPHSAAPERNLISGERVRGTAVYGAQRKRIGTIDHLMIDKSSGRVVYAMMSFGGFLGVGESIYPIPWAKLSYDTALEGYSTDLMEEQVKGASETLSASDTDWTTPEWNRRVHAYWNMPYFWI